VFNFFKCILALLIMLIWACFGLSLISLPFSSVLFYIELGALGILLGLSVITGLILFILYVHSLSLEDIKNANSR